MTRVKCLLSHGGRIEEVDLGPAPKGLVAMDFTHDYEGQTYQHCYVQSEEEITLGDGVLALLCLCGAVTVIGLSAIIWLINAAIPAP